MMRNNTLPAPRSKEMRRFHPHASSSWPRLSVWAQGAIESLRPAKSDNRPLEIRMAPPRMTARREPLAYRLSAGTLVEEIVDLACDLGVDAGDLGNIGGGGHARTPA